MENTRKTELRYRVCTFGALYHSTCLCYCLLMCVWLFLCVEAEADFMSLRQLLSTLFMEKWHVTEPRTHFSV